MTRARRVRQLPLLPQEWRWIEFTKIAPPNCRRFYRLELQPTIGGWAVVTFRCRIGQTPRPMVESFLTQEEAMTRALKRIRDRLLHEYTVMAWG